VISESTALKIVVIVAITVLEAVNMVYFGVDSALLMLVIAVLAGLAGYEIGKGKAVTEKALERAVDKLVERIVKVEEKREEEEE